VNALPSIPNVRPRECLTNRRRLEEQIEMIRSFVSRIPLILVLLYLSGASTVTRAQGQYNRRNHP
jgi:hypothetical protein